MDIRHPTTPELLRARDLLLQESLRPEPLSFSIAAEYPLVLGDQIEFSYCVVENNSVIAHLNLWPRRVQHAQGTIDVGFVGNVATHKDRRGLGIMPKLFAAIDEIAQSKHLQALVLWSDLHSFYQKQGFEALGKELRFLFSAKAATTIRHFFPTSPELLTDADLRDMRDLTYPTSAWLERSLAEFRTLLSIPQTAVFTRRESTGIVAFGIVGKGYDMAGVIHEWGCRSSEETMQLVGDVGRAFEWPETMLLCPGSLDSAWTKTLSQHSVSCEQHPMALVKAKKDSSIWRILESSFIWGLDSI